MATQYLQYGPKCDYSPRIGGEITIGIDSFIIVMALITDRLDHADGWTWTTDVSSIVGFSSAVIKVANGSDNEALSLINLGGL